MGIKNDLQKKYLIFFMRNNHLKNSTLVLARLYEVEHNLSIILKFIREWYINNGINNISQVTSIKAGSKACSYILFIKIKVIKGGVHKSDNCPKI